ncbi:MAG: PcfJ domain-containing protein [Saprospiraceae bacterium]
MLRTTQHSTVQLVEQRFQNELHELRRQRHRLPIDTVRFAKQLRFLYLRLTANDTPLTLALRTTDTVLVDYFAQIFGKNATVLRAIQPTMTLLEYANRDQVADEAIERFAKILAQLPLKPLQWKQLRHLATERWLVCLEVVEHPSILQNTFQIERLTVIVSELPTIDNNENLGDDLEVFLLHFPVQFASLIVGKTETEIRAQLPLWFTHWFNFYNQTEVGVELEEEYYELPYWEIIRNVPNYFWWNNGINLFGENRYFYLGSPEFRQLAMGKSVRSLTQIAPFTRRMAKGFNDLFYASEVSENLISENQYFFIYARSLGADWNLATLLTYYLQRPSSNELLQVELDRWQPIIQKMTTFNSERWQQDEQLRRMFLGYIAHLLRDQNGLQVKRRSERELLQEMDRYYARIEERLAVRLERAKQREAVEPKIISWKKSSSIHPLESMLFSKKRAYGLAVHVKIVELTDENQLEREGQQMRHCVGGYVPQCRNRQSSIWSLRELNNKQWTSRMTIEVSRKRTVVQARARFNATPAREYQEVLKLWMEREGLEFVSYGGY